MSSSSSSAFNRSSSAINHVAEIIKILDENHWIDLKVKLSTRDDAELSISLAYVLLSQLYSLCKIDDNPAMMNQVVSELDRVEKRVQMLQDYDKRKNEDNHDEASSKRIRVDSSAAKRVVKHYTS